MTRGEMAKWLENLKGDIGKSENHPLWHYAEAIDLVINALEAMDNTQNTLQHVGSVERLKGRWIRKIVDKGFNADWVCSECGYRAYSDFVDLNYCPNCGADMIPKLIGKHADVTIIDEGANDETGNEVP